MSPQPQLLYFGRILAGQCHELVNALNIAHELCGLHEDTLPRATQGQTGAVDKLGSLARRIDTQVARCTAIVRHLGRFAHAVDQPMEVCDPREIIQRALFFATRQARLRNTELRAVLPEGDLPSVYCSPFCLQQAIHAGIDLLLQGIAENRQITARLTPDPAGVLVNLESTESLPCSGEAAETLAAIAALAHAAGGELRQLPQGGSLAFFIPDHAPGGSHVD